MDPDNVGPSVPRKQPRRRPQEPVVTPVSVVEQIYNAFAAQGSNTSSTESTVSSVPASVRKAQGKNTHIFGKASRSRHRGLRVRDTDIESIWEHITASYAEQGLPAPSYEDMVPEVAQILRPRLQTSEQQSPQSQFEASLAKILRVLFTPDNDLLSNVNQLLVSPTQADSWARVIARYVPSLVQDMFTSEVPDVTQIPWVDSHDAGVYWIGLRPLMRGEEWYDYIGSATGGKGLSKRRGDRYRYDSSASLGRGYFNRVRDHRRKKFAAHLRSIGSSQNIRDVDDLEWATLMVIPGFQDLKDVRDSTYFRWVSMIAEAAFSLWLGSIHKASRIASQCSPWRASGARTRGNTSSPRFDLRFCRPGNQHSPLKEGLRKAFPHRIYGKIQNARYYQKNKERLLEKARDHYVANREKKLAYGRKWNAENKDRASQYTKAWRETNREYNARRKHEYYHENKDEVTQKAHAYYSANRDSILRQKKEYYARNRDKILIRQKKNDQKRRGQTKRDRRHKKK